MRILDLLMTDLSNLAERFRANAKVIFLTTLIVVIIMCATFGAAFFMVLQSAEKVMVPEVEGKDLAEALLEMQARELYPRIELYYSDRPDERGLILQQDPKAGSIVKAGRRISLVVSRGAVIERVGNFVGRNIADVSLELQAIFPSGSIPLLTLREPVRYRESAEPAGTILEQLPAPGTPINEPLQLSLVVSSGMENVEASHGAENGGTSVPNLMGISITELLSLMGRANLVFNFTARELQEGDAAGAVVSQSPAAGARAPEFSTVDVAIAVPLESPPGYVYGIFREELPEYPYPFQVRVDVILPSGERREYLSLMHPGGTLSVPYFLPVGSMISLSALDMEMGLYETARPSVAGSARYSAESEIGARDSTAGSAPDSADAESADWEYEDVF